jgi:hypothetical protein
MNLRRLPAVPSSAVDAIGLALVGMALPTFIVWAMVCSQRWAQKPAVDGVMTFHLSGNGDLRLWNQPIRPQDVPSLLERAHARGKGSAPMVVRLIPDPQVPWGVIQVMLSRLRPNPPQQSWILQLELP